MPELTLVDKADLNELREKLAQCATSLESRSLEDGEDGHLVCSICGLPDDDETGPTHSMDCFISVCRSIVLRTAQ